jgi:hypothetical protein
MMAEIMLLWSFLPLFLLGQQENHGGMELFGIALIILILAGLAATASVLRNDGRGHTPPVRSQDAWSALDLPSTNYTLRIF